jgi:putative radical SAM enzyme (TIGR03279 family)
VIKVQDVLPNSLGAELRLEPGTELLSINGRKLEDFLDWEVLAADDQLILQARLPSGREVEYDIERPEGLPWGVVLEPPSVRRCANRCDFCFVDGNPEGARKTLSIRDDDYRLSFQFGHFATLTNLKPKDIRRIIEYRLSPLYVSVHATDPVIRRWLLRNPEAPDVLQQLRMFAQNGIRMHTQVVLVPGINDGDVLRRSLSDLYDLGDPILSVSVVPVGLTEYSKRQLVREPTQEECRAALAAVAECAERAVRGRGFAWAYGADELYLRAGEPLPPADWYGDFEQVENGVGAVRYLQQRITNGADGLAGLAGRRVGVLTGTSMAPLMPQVLEPLAQATGAAFEVIPVVNSFFGDSVTTAGLLPGKDCSLALASRTDLDLALLPAEALNDNRRFIDDMRAEAFEREVSVPVRFSYDFVDVLGDAQ